MMSVSFYLNTKSYHKGMHVVIKLFSILILDVCRCTTDAMDLARKAYGTDEDVILIFRN